MQPRTDDFHCQAFCVYLFDAAQPLTTSISDFGCGHKTGQGIDQIVVENAPGAEASAFSNQP